MTKELYFVDTLVSVKYKHLKHCCFVCIKTHSSVSAAKKTQKKKTRAHTSVLFMWLVK